MPARAHTRPLGFSIALLTLLTAVVFAPSSATKAAAETPYDKPSAEDLPFTMPSGSTLRAGKKVFAHYVPWYPVSLDNKAASTPDYYNKNYLAIDGEGGKYAVHGGLMRDRPFPRAPIDDADWRVRDMETEVRSAQAAGLDGFVVSITSFGTTRTALATKDLMRAAASVGNFKIILRPNMIAGGVKDLSAATLAKNLAELAKSPAAYRLSDGRLVVSPFKAEADSVTWWKGWLSAMENTYGESVAFWPMFLNEMTWGPAFAEISYGEATWGERNAENIDLTLTHRTSPRGRVAAVKARGDKWMQPVSLQDARPSQYRYFESQNSANLRKHWQLAIMSDADMVHIPTWNDYAEGSQIGPSNKMRSAPLDINAYYLSWYKTGVAPTIVRDAIYLSHRGHLSSTKPSAYTAVMKVDGDTTVHDNAEALVFLTAPATVTVAAGTKTASCQAPAGVSVCKVGLAAGSVKASVSRSGATVTSVTSRKTVTATPVVQDMDYVYTGSLRNGTSAAPVPTTTSSTETLVASADSFVESRQPEENRGTSQTLVADGFSAKMSYLRFNLPTAPSGRRLIGATLKVRTTSDWYAGSPSAYAVKLSGDSWSEAGLTWTNRPAVSNSVGSLTATARSTTYSSSLSADSLAGLLGQQITLSVSGSAVDGIYLASSDSSDVASRPQLVLTFG